LRAPSASIDQTARGEDPSPGGADGSHDLPSRSTGRDHVLHDDDTFAWLENEAAAQDHGISLPLGEETAAAEAAGDLVGDEDSAESRGHDGRGDDVHEERTEGLGEVGSETRGEHGVHEHPGTLKVARRVKPRGQEKVTLEKGATLLEKRQQIRGHGATLSRRGGLWQVTWGSSEDAAILAE
jgi:hypothetical protein